jgi:Rrf2 family protein
MRISAKADYAVRALLEIARAGQGPVTAERLAQAQGIPRGFLLAILAEMRRGGLVQSQRGQAGGWVLGRDAASISVAEVIRVVDGPLGLVHGRRPESVAYDGSAADLQQVWIAARSSLRGVLEKVNIADLAAGRLPAEVTARSNDDDAWAPH